MNEIIRVSGYIASMKLWTETWNIWARGVGAEDLGKIQLSR